MKYIDAEKLIKAIEEKGLDCSFALKMERLDTLALIDSLQHERPEVDLEEITKFSRIIELPEGFEKSWLKYYHTDEEYNSAKYYELSTLEREYIIARHFYELGKNARK